MEIKFTTGGLLFTKTYNAKKFNVIACLNRSDGGEDFVNIALSNDKKETMEAFMPVDVAEALAATIRAEIAINKQEKNHD